MNLSTVLLAALILATSLHAQTVSTQYGPVTGHLNGAVYEFLGIPFAVQLRALSHLHNSVIFQ